MATYTKNYNLKKPGIDDNVMIDDLNGNADVIDAELKKRVQFDASGRVPLGQETIIYKEFARFTQSGTFNPGSYATIDGKYDVLIIGGGGSGAYASAANKGMGGESGGILSVTGLPMPSGMNYNVTVGKGGEGVNVLPNSGISNRKGNPGSASSFAGFTAPGGKGGTYGEDTVTPTTANGYTHNVGTSGSSGKGGDSIVAAGGNNNMAGSGGDGMYGSGGGAAFKSGNDGTNYSGAGGDGLVIVCGWIGGR